MYIYIVNCKNDCLCTQPAFEIRVDRHFRTFYFLFLSSVERIPMKIQMKNKMYKRRSSTVSTCILYRFRRYTDLHLDSIDTKSTWTLFVAMQLIQRRNKSHSRNNNIIGPHRGFIQALTLTEFKFKQRPNLIRF